MTPANLRYACPALASRYQENRITVWKTSKNFQRLLRKYGGSWYVKKE